MRLVVSAAIYPKQLSSFILLSHLVIKAHAFLLWQKSWGCLFNLWLRSTKWVHTYSTYKHSNHYTGVKR